MTVNTQHVTFDSVSVGDQLPPFTITETQSTIDAARIGIAGEEDNPRSIHTDPEFAQAGLFAGTVNSGVTTMAYVTQLLERWFPVESLYDGGSLSLKATQPIRPGDTVTFTGEVTDKRRENGKKLVVCRVTGVNQLGVVVGLADARLVVSNR